MAVTQDNVIQYQYSNSLNRRYWDYQYTYDNFISNPASSALGGGAASGTTGAVNILTTNTTAYEYHVLGAGETILAPSIASISTGVSALNPELDVTNNEGIELCAGILSSNRNAFQIASSKAFFFRTRMKIGTVAHTDDCAMGFRKAEAYQANIDDYADMAVLNVITGNINIETIVGSASTVTTDTTDNWADGETKDLEVDVDATGAVTYSINGSAPTVTAAYSFTSGLTVLPFFYLLHDSTNTNVINFSLDFVAGNSIVATIDSVPLAAVLFNADQATTIADLAIAIALDSHVASATVTGARQITVVFNVGGANTVNSVVTSGGLQQAVATFVRTADATLGCRLLQWECGLK